MDPSSASILASMARSAREPRPEDHTKPSSDSLAKRALQIGQAARDNRKQATMQYARSLLVHIARPCVRMLAPSAAGLEVDVNRCVLAASAPTDCTASYAIDPWRPTSSLRSYGCLEFCRAFQSGCQLSCHFAWERKLFYALLPRNQRTPVGKPCGTPNHGCR